MWCAFSPPPDYRTDLLSGHRAACRAAQREIGRTPAYLVFTVTARRSAPSITDHYDLLLGQDYLFARKISPEAIRLRERLGALWAASGVHFPISNEATGLYRFLTGRGRIGHRPAVLETDGSWAGPIRCCWWCRRNGMSPSG